MNQCYLLMRDLFGLCSGLGRFVSYTFCSPCVVRCTVIAPRVWPGLRHIGSGYTLYIVPWRQWLYAPQLEAVVIRSGKLEAVVIRSNGRSLYSLCFVASIVPSITVDCVLPSLLCLTLALCLCYGSSVVTSLESVHGLVVAYGLGLHVSLCLVSTTSWYCKLSCFHENR
jgi:hypothetical protein